MTLKSVMFGNPKFVMDTKISSNRHFLCCNIKSYDRHLQFSLPNFEKYCAHSKICLEEYASTLSELNTFISALCKELGKGFVWRYAI